MHSAGAPARAGVLDAGIASLPPLVRAQLHRPRACRPRRSGRCSRRAAAASCRSSPSPGTVALAPSAPYAAAKSAALSWARSYGAAAREHGVAVTIVNPGPVATPGFPQSALLRSRWGRLLMVDAERCAERLLAAADRRAPEVFVPQWWRVAAAFQGAAPALTARVAGARLAHRSAPAPETAPHEQPGRADHRRQLRHRPRHRTAADRARLRGRADAPAAGSPRSARRRARRDRRRRRRLDRGGPGRDRRRGAPAGPARLARQQRRRRRRHGRPRRRRRARARRVLEPNFYAHVALTDELWPLLRESPRARVIVVSSSLGTYSSSGSITYGASKAALTSWARALTVAARPLGIEVTVVNPGPVVTTTFPHHELLQHRWKGKLVIGVEQCVNDVMRRVDRGGGELWSHRSFRLPAVAAGDRAVHVRPLFRVSPLSGSAIPGDRGRRSLTMASGTAA